MLNKERPHQNCFGGMVGRWGCGGGSGDGRVVEESGGIESGGASESTSSRERSIGGVRRHGGRGGVYSVHGGNVHGGGHVSGFLRRWMTVGEGDPSESH